MTLHLLLLLLLLLLLSAPRNITEAAMFPADRKEIENCTKRQHRQQFDKLTVAEPV
jgi:hypothetical protein